MKNGIALIAKERLEQKEKHGISIDNDVNSNNLSQLRIGAYRLIQANPHSDPPHNWDAKVWRRMINKPLKERLIIAGALIAAEIDRIETLNQ